MRFHQVSQGLVPVLFHPDRRLTCRTRSWVSSRAENGRKCAFGGGGGGRFPAVGFTRAELAGYYGQEVPDLVGLGLRLLFVGINPGLWTAAVQTHFAHPGNRFYPALLAAGIIEHPIDPAAGMDDADRARFVARGLGITNLVRRATARADELRAPELREGAQRLADFVAEHRPTVVAVLGITAYRPAFGDRTARSG